jgi:hypothetical protein
MDQKKVKRDPRIDPRIGDTVLKGRRVRTVYTIREQTFLAAPTRLYVGWATEEPIASGVITLKAWQKWAEDGEVLWTSN